MVCLKETIKIEAILLHLKKNNSELLLKTTLSNSILTAVIESHGAELISLKNKRNEEYIWEGNPEFWGKHSPVLFPIVGTLKNNEYRYQNKSYSMSRHGFARDMEFKIKTQSEGQVVYSLTANQATKALYPFDFELEICYTLDEKTLTVSYTVINNSSVRLPFSIGGHPAFALREAFENYALAFEKTESLVSYPLENGLLSNTEVLIPTKQNLLPLSYSLFENDALVFKQLQSIKITLFENQKPRLHFHFEDFKNFGIWTKNKAPFICLEPWLGYSDTISTSGNLEEKEGIQFAAPESSNQFVFKIEIV